MLFLDKPLFLGYFGRGVMFGAVGSSIEPIENFIV
jgi:hypothetical protein